MAASRHLYGDEIFDRAQDHFDVNRLLDNGRRFGGNEGGMWSHLTEANA